MFALNNVYDPSIKESNPCGSSAIPGALVLINAVESALGIRATISSIVLIATDAVRIEVIPCVLVSVLAIKAGA